MRRPDPMKPFIIDCDASIIKLGAALPQRDSDSRVPSGFRKSHVVRLNEKKWTITEQEALTVVWALEIFRLYSEGTCTLVRTDHSPLLWLRNNANTTAKLAQWILRLQEFNFQLRHRPGPTNGVAAALSENPLVEELTQSQPSSKELISAFVGQSKKW